MKRWPPLVLIVALIVGAVAYDARLGREAAGGPDRSDGGTADPAVMMPQAAPASAVGSTWYCAAGTATGQEGAQPSSSPSSIEPVADHRVVVANPSDRALTATLTAYPSRGRTVARPIEVAARSQVSVRLADLVQAPYAAAMVELAGGGAVVEHELRGPLGMAVAPCADRASDSWFFAAGSTVRGASETLVFFNPFPADAVLDVSFATDEGRRAPQQFQNVSVPGRSVRAMTVTDKVTIRAVVAASVEVRTGRVVVDRIQAWDGTPPPDPPAGDGAVTTTTTPTTAPPGDGDGGEVAPEDRPDEQPVVPDEPEAAASGITRTGLSVALGVPHPSPIWFFPDGRRVEGASEQYVLYNPGTETAELEVTITPAEPERFGVVDPIRLSVGPGAVEVLDVDGDDRIPTDAAHHAIVRSENDVAVVAERVSGGTVFGSIGAAIEPGSPLVARQWFLTSGADGSDAATLSVVLFNPGDRTATVVVESFADGAIGPVGGRGAIEVAPDGRATVSVDIDEAEHRTVVVTSDQPIVVERARYPAQGGGFTASMGVPSRETARAPSTRGERPSR